MTEPTINPDREFPSLENVERFPTLRGWEPSTLSGFGPLSVVPMPSRRKLKDPDPFFAFEAEHSRLYEKMRPLEQAAWKLRHLPEDNHRRRKVLAAIDDLYAKIGRLEDQIFGHVASKPVSPAVLLACLNMFRDWVDIRREAMVDVVQYARADAGLPRRAAAFSQAWSSSMTADPLEVRDGMEAVALRLYRMLSLSDQRTFLDAALRTLDGQPIEDAMTEWFVELGDAPAEARRKVREAINSEPNWRRLLD